jgi:hypothetical protein
MDLLWYWLGGLLLTVALVGGVYLYAAYQVKRPRGNKGKQE